MNLDVSSTLTESSAAQGEMNMQEIGIDAFALQPGSPLSGLPDHFNFSGLNHEFLSGDLLCNLD